MQAIVTGVIAVFWAFGKEALERGPARIRNRLAGSGSSAVISRENRGGGDESTRACPVHKPDYVIARAGIAD